MPNPTDTYVLGSGDTEYPNYVGNNVSTVIINAASGTGSQTLLTGAPGYYITRFYVTVDPNCTTGTAGMGEITATDSVAGVIGRTRVYLSASFLVSSTAAQPSLISSSDAGFFYISKNANSTVTVQISQALTGTGIIRVSANWGTTSKVGV